MKSYDEKIQWSDLGRPEEPVEIDVFHLNGFVIIEEEHIDKAARLGGNPIVFLRDISAPQYEPIKTWEIVDLHAEGSSQI